MATDLREQLQSTLGTTYIIDRELGRGGMATVYLARDLKHRRHVALKVLHPDLGHALGAERFLREIETAARLTHPHILPLHDSGDAAGMLFYVMPYVEGESLRSRLERARQLPVGEALRIAAEVASALDYAHRQGVVHRDIKPANILLVDGHAVVADFGIARALHRAGGEALTRVGMTLGTPGYMSPEQALGESEIDGRSDVYALGCVLYEMLAGRPPFSGSSTRAIVAQQLTQPPRPIGEVVAGVPATVEASVARALAAEPAERFATAAEFSQALTLPAGVRVTPAAPVAGNAVAVLDFVNLSTDRSLAWLGAGIAESVNTDLRKLSQVRVIGRDQVVKAAMQRGGPAPDEHAALEVGRAVGARWVVCGGFQCAGNRLRITPSFVDTATGAVVSAAKIDGPMDELFALQDRIVTALTDVLAVELSAADLRKIAVPETARLSAYEYFARGRQLFMQFGKRSFDEARRHFEEAIAADPGYALAHSGLGSILAFRYIATTKREDLDAAIAHLERALALDPDLAEPYQWLAYAYLRANRLLDAERAALRATELDPESALAYYQLGGARHMRATMEYRWASYVDAVPAYARSIELSPAYQAAYMNLAYLYTLNGKYAPARRLLDRAVEIEDSHKGKEVHFVGALTQRAALHLREGRLAEAVALLERALPRYAGADHVYAELFTALTRCALGEVAHREGAYDLAVRHYTQAGATCEANAEKLGMGYMLVKARVGLAKAFEELRMRREAAAQLTAVEGLLSRREGYVFSMVWEGSDGQAYAELASCHAAAGHPDRAFASLERAVDCAWGDLPSLEGDDGFSRCRQDPRMDALRARVAARGLVPDFGPDTP